MFSAGCRIEEAEKAMPAEKLAELTASDPKRTGREAHKNIYARKKKNSEMKKISGENFLHL